MTVHDLRILFVTSQWPTAADSHRSPFVKTEVESLRQLGVTVDVFYYVGGWSPRRYHVAMIRFLRQITMNEYDLAHVRFGQSGIIALGQRQLPVVVRFGGSDLIGWREPNGNEPLASKVLRATSRLVARKADEVIIVSRHMADYLPKRDYHVIPAGVDLNLFQPMDQMEARRRLGLPLTKKMVLFAADPAKVTKRFKLAHETVALIKDRMDVQLIITSRTPHEQMPMYMSACDVLLLTSQHEGSPNVVKEALACNLPVVSVDVGDVRERVNGQEQCVVCDDDAPRTLAWALESVLTQAVRPGLRHLVADLEMHAIAKSIVKVYKQALSG